MDKERLAELRTQLENINDDFSLLKAAKKKVVDEILDICKPPDKGTHRYPPGLKIVTGYERVFDNEALSAVQPSIDPNMWPFINEHKENRKGTKWIEANEPEIWALIEPALTLKPKSPAITVEDEQ